MAVRLTASNGGALNEGVCTLQMSAMPRQHGQSSFDIVRNRMIIARVTADAYVVDQAGAYQVIRYNDRGTPEWSNTVVVRRDLGGNAQPAPAQDGRWRWLRWLLGILGAVALLALLWWLFSHAGGANANAEAHVTLHAPASSPATTPGIPGPVAQPAPVPRGSGDARPLSIIPAKEAEALIAAGTAQAFLSERIVGNLRQHGRTVGTTTIRGQRVNFLSAVFGGRTFHYWWEGKEDPEMGVFHLYDPAGGGA